MAPQIGIKTDHLLSNRTYCDHREYLTSRSRSRRIRDSTNERTAGATDGPFVADCLASLLQAGGQPRMRPKGAG